MDAPGGNRDDETIGHLFGQLIEDGGDLVRAEINVYRRLVQLRLAQSRTGAILAVCGLWLVQASVVALLVGLVIGLSRWIGPVGAGAVVTLVALGVGGLLLKLAFSKLSAVASKK